MSIWGRFSQEQKSQYIQFLKAYGSLTNLFRQKQGDLIPYLDSKFQETIFAKVFEAQGVDIGNTPHDVLSVFSDLRVGIGLKTWMNSNASYQKVMQIKSFQGEINALRVNPEAVANKVSLIKNEKLVRDYNRLGLSENSNIYHYVTRDIGKFSIYESLYTLIDIDRISDIVDTLSALYWSDGIKEYKYTYADSQIWQKFDPSKSDTIFLSQFDVVILKDPFDILLRSFSQTSQSASDNSSEFVEAYLPLYSFSNKQVGERSGLNAWNAASKSKDSNIPRPLNEVYVPIPIEFHRKNPDFFRMDITSVINKVNSSSTTDLKPEIRFHLILPNGKRIPALLTQQNLKALESGSKTELDANGKKFGQSALGQWLLIEVLGLKERKLVTIDWLKQRGTDSIKLWRRKNDYSTFYIDFAPVGSFEAFMSGNSILPLEE